jgi:hypothetical protein
LTDPPRIGEKASDAKTVISAFTHNKTGIHIVIAINNSSNDITSA